MKVDYARMLSDVAAQQAQVGLDQVTFDRDAVLGHGVDRTSCKQFFEHSWSSGGAESSSHRTLKSGELRGFEANIVL